MESRFLHPQTIFHGHFFPANALKSFRSSMAVNSSDLSPIHPNQLMDQFSRSAASHPLLSGSEKCDFPSIISPFIVLPFNENQNLSMKNAESSPFHKIKFHSVRSKPRQVDVPFLFVLISASSWG